MACSVCKEKGHDKRQCPKTEELKIQTIRLRRDRANVFIGSAFANTLGSAITYALLSQKLQRQGYWENIAGETLDATILGAGIFQAEPSMVIGALISQVLLETDLNMDSIVEEIITTIGERDTIATEPPHEGESFPLTGSGTII